MEEISNPEGWLSVREMFNEHGHESVWNFMILIISNSLSLLVFQASIRTIIQSIEAAGCSFISLRKHQTINKCM